MAERPVHIPQMHGPLLVRSVPVTFTWHSGFAWSQKRKSMHSLHANAIAAGICRKPLEVSIKSPEPAGVALSAHALQAVVDCTGRKASVDATVRASQVFVSGGPFPDLLFAPSKEAKADPRLSGAEALVGYELLGDRWPLEPASAFFTWVYLHALHRCRDAAVAEQASAFDAFTDIDFNPNRSGGCQAYASALYCALSRRDWLSKALASRKAFLEIMADQRAAAELPRSASAQTELLAAV